MTSVYAVTNDCPDDWGDPGVLAVYKTRKIAQTAADCLLSNDPYFNQYIIVQRLVVREVA